MAKISDYMKGREDGLLMARDIVKEGGLESLEKEIVWRNITGINTGVAMKDIGIASQKIKEQTIDTVKALTIETLHDEFGFGKARCERFIARYDLKTECLLENLFSWHDLIESIYDQIGLNIKIRWNK